VRRAIPQSQESLAALAERDDVHPKTVAKWKTRACGQDAPMGPKPPRSTVLTQEEDALMVVFRKPTLLPLDDGLYALQATLPHLPRSALHRWLQRHGMSRLPEVAGATPKKKQCRRYPIGSLHIEIAEVRTEEGTLCLFVAIDRTSTFAEAELHPSATKAGAAPFLRHLIAAVPDRIQTMLTDNSIQFTTREQDTYACKQIVARVCDEHALEHRLTHPHHPWTNGQVERMNRTLQDAPVKQYYDQSPQPLKAHLDTFLMAYNCAKRLKTLKGLTPYAYICKIWPQAPERFTIHPCHHTLGLNI
jgi:Integrase core domain